jgi:hypothetical protein
MVQNPAEAGAVEAGGTSTDFDDADDLLVRLYELCSPEQKQRGRTAREVLGKLLAHERAEVMDRLSPELREEMRRLIGR